jgi:ATP-binding cassette, subfamily B (MDR/TAP), member 1
MVSGAVATRCRVFWYGNPVLLFTWVLKLLATHILTLKTSLFPLLFEYILDVHDVGGIAAQIGPNANKFRRGVGRKLGEAIQFFTTGLGGLIFAFYSSWQVSLVVLLVLPFVALATTAAMTFNQTKGQRAAESYKRAGSVAYAAVSAIKTVLSLNAIPPMVQQYTAATTEAFILAKSYFVKVGFANGSMLGSFLCLYCVLTLFGSFLLYSDVLDTGCDPSGSVPANDTCTNDGRGVFGAMLGVAFAGQGVSQFGNCATALAAARTAVYEALVAIRRTPGTDSVVIYKEDKSGSHSDKKKKDSDDDDSFRDLGVTTVQSSMSSQRNKNTTRHSKDSGEDDVEDAALTTDVDSDHHDDSGNMSKEIKAILPKYEIDSFSTAGLKPSEIQGRISIKNVHFSYPTRPHDKVLNGLSAEIQPGAVIAFVGPVSLY